MPMMVVTMQSDAVFGVPPGDQGRTDGHWSLSGTTDWGIAVQQAGDGKTVIGTTLGTTQAKRLRFLPNPVDLLTLTTNLGTQGSIVYIQPFIVQQSSNVTGSDNGFVFTFCQAEKPSNGSIVLLLDQSSRGFQSVPFVTSLCTIQSVAPDGSPWTPTTLGQTEFSFTINDGGSLGFHPYDNRWTVDQYALNVYYSASSQFPISAPGNVGGCAMT